MLPQLDCSLGEHEFASFGGTKVSDLCAIVVKAVAELGVSQILSSMEVQNAAIRLQHLCEINWKTLERSSFHVSLAF